ncbi:MAG TPA: hypothetical protein VIP80_12855 [Gemmatimonadales bacterium]|jgi:hypothetical protein
MPQRRIRLLGLSFPVLLAGLGAWLGNPRPQAPAFDHAVHLPLFPGGCTTCHVGAAEPGASFWPAAASCAACHDGVVKPRISWAAPGPAAPSNLRFTHDRHRAATADSVGCGRCHTLADSGRSVFRRLVNQCIGCHQPGAEHLSVANAQCATCHFPLAEAKGLPSAAVARFPRPAWHQVEGFGLGGHGERAAVKGPDGRPTVAASCATCHAQNFCINCHVNAPEVPAIRALASDDRSLVHRFTFAAPPTHAAPNFLALHGRQAKRSAASCATCHTQPSCATCHVGTTLPKPVTLMHQPGPGRAPGAQLVRHPPRSHVASFREGHSREASAAPRTCAMCHMQADCLSCHRPNPAQPAGGGDYHPTGFLVRHPASAYARQSTCGDCHNAQQFCVSCHAQAGLNARRSLGSSTFHDGRAAFILGHGQAARQSLESCVSCHVERDCTACHSSVGRGFRFNPHGPGFDPVRLRRRNPEMCIACHGRAIPGLP